MTDEKSQPIPPLKVAIIEGTGDGTQIPSGTMAVTPSDHQPNIRIKVVAPIVAILVRAGNTFFVTFSGLLAGSGLGLGVLAGASLKGMILTALLPTFVGAVKDCATIFGKLENRWPLSTGSI